MEVKLHTGQLGRKFQNPILCKALLMRDQGCARCRKAALGCSHAVRRTVWEE